MKKPIEPGGVPDEAPAARWSQRFRRELALVFPSNHDAGEADARLDDTLRMILKPWARQMLSPTSSWERIYKAASIMPIRTARCEMSIERMYFFSDILYKETHQSMLREAQQFHLIQEAIAGREPQARLYCRALSWLGRRLVAWGWSLQRRFGSSIERPMKPAVDHAR